MTDHPRSPDDQIRDALHAGARDVHADDALLARIRTATAPPPAWRRRTPLLAMAAALVVIAGLAAMVLTRDDETVVLEEPDTTDPHGTASTATTSGLAHHDEIVALFGCDGISPAVVVVLVGGPEGSFATVQDAMLATPGRTGEEVLKPKVVAERLTAAGTPADEQDVPGAVVGWFASTDAAMEARATLADLPGVMAISTTDCAEGAANRGERPTLVALVRDDGWLVTVDLETGEQRELHTEGDPRRAEPGLEEGGPYFIDAVDLSPDGDWIYFSTCCEPADGMTFRIPTGGGGVEEVGFGSYPRVSPDGRYVATAGSAYLYVRPTDDVGFDRQPSLLEIGCCARRLAWSPDGTELALVYGTGAEGETPQIRRFTWDGTTLAEADMGKPDNPGWFVLWNPDGMPVTFDGDPVADDRGLSQDRSFEWLLFVDEAGVVNAGRFDTGDIPPVTGLPRAIAADW